MQIPIALLVTTDKLKLNFWTSREHKTATTSTANEWHKLWRWQYFMTC